MEATYCVGNDIDVSRMFDQYLYKRSENLDVSLSIPHTFHSNNYDMNDQTFHTPSFGDEEFDIPAIQPQHVQGNQQAMQNYQQQQMQQIQSLNSPDGIMQHDPNSGYQQPIYMSNEQQMQMNQGYVPQGQYNNQQLLIIQQQQQQMMMQNQQNIQAQYGRSPQGARTTTSPPAPTGQEPTTSEDSDDSTPHQNVVTGIKRPSPEPEVVAKVQKKPKVAKKKKKRDPNEPQKPVSAYALFFRDTQAAIKGQNPNASFGEVSKIVASMWDALDSEHKNVYKKKTEAAKKEYLKALAAYRASLVSKGTENEPIYGNYANYGQQNQYSGYSPQNNMASPNNQAMNQNMAQKKLMSPMNGNMSQQNMLGHQSHVNMGQGHIMGQGQVGTNNYGQQVAPVQVQQQIPHMHMSPGGEHHLSTSPPIGGPPPGRSPPLQQQSPMNPPQSPMNPPGPMNQGQMSQPPMNQGQMSQPPMNQGPMTQQGPMSQTQMNQGPMNQSPHQGSMNQPMSQPNMNQGPMSQGSMNQGPMNQGPMSQGPVGQQQAMGQGGPQRQGNGCIRHGCPNPAISNAEWEDEYCSNECVVSHCRDVFSTWVASNPNQTQNFSTVK